MAVLGVLEECVLVVAMRKAIFLLLSGSKRRAFR